MEAHITVLGSGTSQGVPVIGCKCPVCQSNDPKDNRLRCSILIEIKGKTFVIDTGPDFRQQMLKNRVDRLDAVIFTHEHKDHIAGLDDIRAFNFIDNKSMDIYCTEAVEFALKREFHYAFAKDKYPGVPELNLIRIDKSPFKIGNNFEIIPIEVMHYKMPVLGFRIGNFAYITDAKTISKEELSKLNGVEVLIVNALRKEPHISHFNLEEALQFIAEVNPKQAYLTHISHLFAKHQELSSELPSNVAVAFDGLKFSIEA